MDKLNKKTPIIKLGTLILIIISWLLLFLGLLNLLLGSLYILQYNDLISGSSCPNFSSDVGAIPPEMALVYCWTKLDAPYLLSLCVLFFIKAIALLIISYGIRWSKKWALYAITFTIILITPFKLYLYYILERKFYINYTFLIIDIFILIYLWLMRKKFT